MTNKPIDPTPDEAADDAIVDAVVTTVEAMDMAAAGDLAGAGKLLGESLRDAAAAGEDLAPPTYEATLTFWADMFMSVADDAATALETLDSVVEPAHRAAIAAVWNAVGATAMRGAATIGAWLDGVPVDAPELVAAAEDPGDLTCPRCDGPIPLAELRNWGICATCEAKESAELAAAAQLDDAEAVS